MVDGGIEAQANQVLANLKAVPEAGLSGLNQVIKSTVFFQNLDDFKTVNETCGLYFADHEPARSTIQVAALPLDSLVEIEAVALAG